MLPVAILAGGLATRLRPTTESIPKSLLEVRGEPFLAHQLRLLKRSGIERVVMCVSYLGEQIRDYARDGRSFGLQIEYSFDGPKLLGTAGALRRALPLLGDSFFVLYGDSYLPCDYAAVAKAFVAFGKQGLMTVFRNEGQWDSSNVEFNGERIVAYDKINRTAAMHHIDYGLGVFRREVFDAVGEDKHTDLASIYHGLLHLEQLAAFQVTERFYEIGSWQGIKELSEFLPI